MRLFCPVGGTGGGPTSAHFPDRLWRYSLTANHLPPLSRIGTIYNFE